MELLSEFLVHCRAERTDFCVFILSSTIWLNLLALVDFLWILQNFSIHGIMVSSANIVFPSPSYTVLTRMTRTVLNSSCESKTLLCSLS